MGPHRIIHNRRGYLTETVLDAESGQFRERPFPPMGKPEPPKPSSTTDAPQSALHQTDLHGLARVFDGNVKSKET